MSVLGEHWAQLLADLERGFALLNELPPAVTFFGGARIREDDPAYALSQEIGRLLAEAGIPPRTGAGPGIMTSVPEGYKAALAEQADQERHRTSAIAKGMVEAYARESRRITRRLSKQRVLEEPPPETQGIKIFLPFEPEENAAIDKGVELTTFPIRRLMLYENSLGLVVFPGGFGTLDELFEVWARRRHARHKDPIVLVERAFFEPLLNALRRVLLEGKRHLAKPEHFADVLLTDDPQDVVNVFARSKGLVGFDEDPVVLARRLTHELPYVAGALRRTDPAVTVLGGARLAADDPTVLTARQVLARLAERQVPLRVGNHGRVAQAGLAAYAERPRLLQGFFDLGRDPDTSAPDAGWTPQQIVEVSDPIAHKLLLSQATLGFLVLPGDLRTLDELFTVLCEVQTGKLERRPIVLLGSDHWRPVLDACAEVMLTGSRRTISPEDLDLFAIVDDPEAALAALEL